MKKILVIGKFGQIANALGKLSVPDEIVLLSKDEININDWDKTREKIFAIHPDIVINTAAYHHLPACEANPKKAFLLNTLSVLNLAKICKELAIPLLTYSTDYVFDGTKQNPYLESDIPNPLQVYGISKLAGEYAALNYYSEGTYIIRTNAVFGGLEGSREKKGNFVLSILADKSKILHVRPDLTVSPTYAADLAKASYELLYKAKPGVYHLVNEGVCSWLEFASLVLEYGKIQKEIKPRTLNTQTDSIKRPTYSALKNTKGIKLGIILPNWQDALKRYIIKELKYE